MLCVSMLSSAPAGADSSLDAELSADGIQSVSQANGGLSSRVVEGDILVPGQAFRRSLSVPVTVQLWTDGVVPYRIDPDLPRKSVSAIESAVEHWNKVSGISLIPLTSWPQELALPLDSVLFQPGEGCASWVGKRGGEQEVWVAPNCAAGSLMHEIGHVLGLEHEHTRPDRDQYISIHWDNISPEKHHNFDVAPEGSRMLGAYDYDSIMHYGRQNFSHNGKPTITPLMGLSQNIGQRKAPSAGDLSAIARLYATDLSIVTQLYQEAPASQINIYVSNEYDQGAHQVEVMVYFEKTASLQQYSGNGWQCIMPNEGQAQCTLARLQGSSDTVLELGLDSIVNAETLSASVLAKTPDVDLSNNIDGSGLQIEQAVDPLPGLGAANAFESNAFEDPALDRAQAGALMWLFPCLLLLLFQRQAGGRINGHARHRVE